MARRTTPVPQPTLAADHATVMALQGLSDYQPINPVYSTAQLMQAQAALTQAEQAEKEAEIALAQARSVRAEMSHTYHDLVVGARAQVIAQYGPDAPAIALIGLTRKSDRKRPVKRQAAITAQ
jgi:hypothetical protein